VGSGLTSSGTDYIDVKWTVATSSSSGWGGGGSVASVSGTSKNFCSNNTASGWLTQSLFNNKTWVTQVETWVTL
jgi:hypothetical protein